jgi:hypothetical protein
LVQFQLQLPEGSLAGERPDDLDDQPFWIFIFFISFSFLYFIFCILLCWIVHSSSRIDCHFLLVLLEVLWFGLENSGQSSESENR